MKIAYITANSPWGKQETFVVNEMLAMKSLDADLLIVPRNPPKKVFHTDASKLLNDALWLPLISFKILFSFFIFSVFNFKVWKIIRNIVKNSNSVKIVLKNLGILPKAVYLSKTLKKQNIAHIHAHWGSTTSSMALIISELTNIPWSMTLHRWDIVEENNMLAYKVEKSHFTRCISKDGYNELLKIVGNKNIEKIFLIHMGVEIPTLPELHKEEKQNSIIFATPANLIPVKGHKYLIQAGRILKEKNITNCKFFIIGDGILEPELKQMIKDNQVEEMFHFTGRLSNNKLLEMYNNKEIDVVVLPSLHEGIPVSIMEALVYQIPVISTHVGGTPEILSPGGGIIVPPADSKALADALLAFINDSSLRDKCGVEGRKTIIEEFDLNRNTENLLHKIKLSI